MKIVWLVLLQHLNIEYTEKLEQNQIVGEGYLQNAFFSQILNSSLMLITTPNLDSF